MKTFLEKIEEVEKELFENSFYGLDNDEETILLTFRQEWLNKFFKEKINQYLQIFLDKIMPEEKTIDEIQSLGWNDCREQIKSNAAKIFEGLK